MRARDPRPGWAVPLAVGACLLAASSCSEDGPRQPGSSPPAQFRLGERVVASGELHRFLLREVGLPPEEIDERALPAYRRELAAQMLFADAARKMGLKPDAEALAAERSLLRELSPGADEAMLESEARRRVLARAYESQVLAERVFVSSEEVEAHLASRPRRAEKTAVFRQIVVAGEREASEVYRRLARGEEAFEEVAREVSTGPELGALQQVPLSHLPGRVQRVIDRTPEGTVSRPVEIEGSHYLFQVQALNSSSDPARTREREEVRRRLFREKLDALRNQHVARLARSAGVELPDGGGA